MWALQESMGLADRAGFCLHGDLVSFRFGCVCVFSLKAGRYRLVFGGGIFLAVVSC